MKVVKSERNRCFLRERPGEPRVLSAAFLSPCLGLPAFYVSLPLVFHRVGWLLEKNQESPGRLMGIRIVSTCTQC